MMEEMLASLAGQRQSDEAGTPDLPLKEAQRDELMVIRKQMTVGKIGDFEKWDEVVPVHRTGSIAEGYVTGAVFVFWRYISVDEAFRRLTLMGRQGAATSLFYPNPDCLVGWLAKEGLRFEIFDSALLVKVNAVSAPHVEWPPSDIDPAAVF